MIYYFLLITDSIVAHRTIKLYPLGVILTKRFRTPGKQSSGLFSVRNGRKPCQDLISIYQSRWVSSRTLGVILRFFSPGKRASVLVFREKRAEAPS